MARRRGREEEGRGGGEDAPISCAMTCHSLRVMAVTPVPLVVCPPLVDALTLQSCPSHATPTVAQGRRGQCADPLRRRARHERESERRTFSTRLARREEVPQACAVSAALVAAPLREDAEARVEVDADVATAAARCLARQVPRVRLVDLGRRGRAGRVHDGELDDACAREEEASQQGRRRRASGTGGCDAPSETLKDCW